MMDEDDPFRSFTYGGRAVRRIVYYGAETGNRLRIVELWTAAVAQSRSRGSITSNSRVGWAATRAAAIVGS
jgi:hypothetical protein